MKSKKTHMTTIVEFITRKYKIGDHGSLNVKALQGLQNEYLIAEIRKKPLHSILFNCLEDTNVDVTESSAWLTYGNISPRSEASFCLLQDRNFLFGAGETNCKHCNSAKKTVDHLATRCGRMLNSDYLRRHNEVVRCIHLHLCRQYGIKRSKRLKTHSVQSIVANEAVEIRVDNTISTDTHVHNNKPDIFVWDKIKNTITLIEIGITSQQIFKKVEVEKSHKYDLLASELALIHKAKVNIVPIVLTWDAIVSKYYKQYQNSLKIEYPVRAYIQTILMKKTLESMCIDYKHGMMSQEDDGFEENITFLDNNINQKLDETDLMTGAFEKESYSYNNINREEERWNYELEPDESRLIREKKNDPLDCLKEVWRPVKVVRVGAKRRMVY
ncbi:uncharacterized protein LOC115228140 [Octopus sinensis]|uniref:Uncharacterized protein LOC115228140 n=1 Tax=Octopus sinensis TaxID=2607531 RepID=A0A6P7TQX9_9MOLL|nr:uncharacterized protein LOC115228140 [Octopus sinensis]